MCQRSLFPVPHIPFPLRPLQSGICCSHMSETASTNTFKNRHVAKSNGQIFVLILLDLLTLNHKSV